MISVLILSNLLLVLRLVYYQLLLLRVGFEMMIRKELLLVVLQDLFKLK